MSSRACRRDDVTLFQKGPNDFRAIQYFFFSSNITGNPQWTMEKLTSDFVYTAEGAKLALIDLKYGEDGRVSEKGLESVIQFFLEYELMPKDRVPNINRFNR